MQVETVCPECHGDGSVFGGEYMAKNPHVVIIIVKCPTCGGRGMIEVKEPCHTCHGRGMVPKGPGIRGIKTCDTCKGRGY